MSEATTTDAIFGGALQLEQPARGSGYRFNVDALLLAREALEAVAAGNARLGRVLDLGTGCGVVGLTLRLLGGCGELVLAERDPWMATLAARNAAPWSDVSVRPCDVASLSGVAPFDLIVCNPPYTDPADGKASPEPHRAGARCGELRPFVEAAARLLAPGGLALFVYPAQGLAALISEASRAGLTAGQLRMVHPHLLAPARVALLRLRSAPGGAAGALPPWFERDEAGRLDPAMEGFLRGSGGRGAGGPGGPGGLRRKFCGVG